VWSNCRFNADAYTGHGFAIFIARIPIEHAKFVVLVGMQFAGLLRIYRSDWLAGRQQGVA